MQSQWKVMEKSLRFTGWPKLSYAWALIEMNWGQNCLGMESSKSNFDSEKGERSELGQEIGFMLI